MILDLSHPKFKCQFSRRPEMLCSGSEKYEKEKKKKKKSNFLLLRQTVRIKILGIIEFFSSSVMPFFIRKIWQD